MNRHLPQTFTDWIGVAGFILALTALGVQYAAYRSDRAELQIGSEALYGYQIVSKLGESTAESVRISVVPATRRLEPSTSSGPRFDLTLVAVNHGRRPIRLISATLTYLDKLGRTQSVMQPIDELLTEERRRAVLTITADAAVLGKEPALISLLDERGVCLQRTLVVPELQEQIAAASKRLYCVDPAFKNSTYR